MGFDCFSMAKRGCHEFSDLTCSSLPSGMPWWHSPTHPLCVAVLCFVIGGWNMKHPEHQCWHRHSWRNPAEDYPNIGRGTDLMSLFSLSLCQVQFTLCQSQLNVSVLKWKQRMLSGSDWIYSVCCSSVVVSCNSYICWSSFKCSIIIGVSTLFSPEIFRQRSN